MRKNLLSIGLAAALGLGASAAMAAPISLPGGSPIFFQFNNIEQISVTNSIDGNGTAAGTPAEGNWGVFNISTVQFGSVTTPNTEISGGTPFFTDGGLGGAQISGIFYGATTTAFSAPFTLCVPSLSTPPCGGSDIAVGVPGTLNSTGGFIDIYWDDTGDVAASDLDGISDFTDFLPSMRTNATDGGKFTDGTLLARLAFAPGIIDGDATTTIKGTLTSTTGGFSGLADSFADVVDINGDGVINSLDGAWASQLNADWFFVDNDNDGNRGEAGERRDLRFSNFFTPIALWDGTGDITGARSNDPGRAFVVPEPASLSLLGLGLLGLGFTARRRKAA
jgi:hypothetical protein